MTAVERTWVAFESQSAPRYRFGSYAHQGVYHHLAGTRPKVAFIATHHVVDFTDHYMATPLAQRGFGFLGWNTRYQRDGAYFHLEHALIDIGLGVTWLREEAGADTVVLLGNSGGGSLMATYQAQASNPDTLGASSVPVLSPGDLYVSVNAHQGRPDVLTAWMDPAVVDENGLLRTDPKPGMFNPHNGPPDNAAIISR